MAKVVQQPLESAHSYPGVISTVEAATTHNRLADATSKLDTEHRKLDSLRNAPPDEGFVFTVTDDNKLALRAVKKIMESDGRIEVESVQPGEQMVTSTFLGWANLAEGLSVDRHRASTASRMPPVR